MRIAYEKKERHFQDTKFVYCFLGRMENRSKRKIKHCRAPARETPGACCVCSYSIPILRTGVSRCARGGDICDTTPGRDQSGVDEPFCRMGDRPSHHQT